MTAVLTAVLVLVLDRAGILSFGPAYGEMVRLALTAAAAALVSVFLQKNISTCMDADRKQYSSIDLLKYICAVLIIILHLRPFLHGDSAADLFFNNIVSRIGVTSFFVITGYFAAEKEKKDPFYIRRYIRGLLPLYLCWSAVYLPALVVLGLQNMDVISPYLDMIRIPRLLLPLAAVLGLAAAIAVMLLYSGTYYHLWYFPALMLDLWIISKWKKKFRPAALLAVSFILLAFGATETYFGLLPSDVQGFLQNFYYGVFFTTRNFLFFGLFYVTMGYCISYYGKEKARYSVLKLLASFGLLAAEAFFLRTVIRLNSNIMFACIPCTYYLFISFLYLRVPLRTGHRFRDFSKYYFLVHPMIILILFTAGFLTEFSSPLVQVILVVGVTHLASMAFIALKRRCPKLPF